MGNVGARLGLTLLQTIQQRLQLFNGVLGFGLRFGLARNCGVLQFGPSLVQQVLAFAALLLQLGEHFLGVNQGFAARVFQMLKQALGEVLQQVQRRTYRVLFGGHGKPPGV
ncbi:MAG: hypothetical protein CFE49_10015 [Pseudomonas sp. PGPPP3]|nr:MAG: hypothetical protein CFE49_10015 [Pseudomonas sp. PGPPP3]